MSKLDKNARVAVRRCVGANEGGGCGRRFVVRRWQVASVRALNGDTRTDRELAMTFVYCPTCVWGHRTKPKKGD